MVSMKDTNEIAHQRLKVAGVIEQFYSNLFPSKVHVSSTVYCTVIGR